MVHIIGGGIAGLMLAEELDRRKVEWQLWEKSGALGAEASGKNAGIIRSYESDPVVARLARESLAYYHKREPSFDHAGIAFIPWEVDYEAPPYTTTKLLSGKEGILLADDGCVEPMAVLQRLASGTYTYGKIHMGQAVSVQKQDGALHWLIPGISVASDDIFVVACGEGAIAVSSAMQRAPSLVPHLRTLYEYENSQNYRGPVQWDEESGCYFRAFGPQIIATAGEQIPVPVRNEGESDDREADSRSAHVLARQFPFLTQDKLQGWRSCRRLMPLDNRPYCGRDHEWPNVYWLTGLGGRGMSIAPALAVLLADQLTGAPTSADLEALSPARVHSLPPG